MVRHQAVAVGVAVEDGVGAVGGVAGVVVDAGAVRAVGAGVPPDGDLLGGELAVAGGAGLQVELAGRPGHGGLELLVAVVHELHRPAGRPGQHRHDGLQLRLRLAPEAAADLGADDAHLVVAVAQALGDGRPDRKGRLGRRVDDQLVVGGVGQGRVGLHDDVLQHAAVEVALHDHVRLGEALLHVAADQLIPVDDVAAGDGVRQAVDGVLRPVLMDEALRGQRVLDGVHHRQRLVLGLDQRYGLLGDPQGVRGHGGHGLPHVPDLVDRQNRLVGDELAVALAALRARQHAAHARQGAGPGDVQTQDAPVGDGAVVDGGVQLAAEVPVGAVLGPARNLGLAVLAGNIGANGIMGRHDSISPLLPGLTEGSRRWGPSPPPRTGTASAGLRRT